MAECPACGAAALAPWRAATASDPQLAGAERFELWRCGRCASAQTIGDAPDHAALYEGGTYAPARRSIEPLLAPLRRLADRDRIRFVAALPAGAKVVEVGAGDGKLVAAMRARGLDAWGLEPSPAASAAARDAGAEVVAVGIEQAEVAPASQGAAVLWHSLEHLDDPAAAVARIATWIEPRGRIVVAVPNLSGLQARIGGDRWFHQDVPRHRTHFTPAGLEAVLRRGGFRVERLGHLGIEQNPLGMWQTLLNRLTGERDVAFRAIKRDLGEAPRGARARDLVITALAGPILIPVAIVLELIAGLTGRGGSIVAEATLEAEG